MNWLRRLFGGTEKAREWSVATGREAGQPVIVRTRTAAPAGMMSERYAASVEIVWRFDGGATGSMPPPDLTTVMAEFEDLLAKLETPANGMLGMSITGNGRREWVWYVADAQAFAARVREAANDRYPVEVRTTVPDA